MDNTNQVPPVQSTPEVATQTVSQTLGQPAPQNQPVNTAGNGGHKLLKITVVLIVVLAVLIGVGYVFGFSNFFSNKLDTNKFFSILNENYSNIKSGEAVVNLSVKALPITADVKGEKIDFSDTKPTQDEIASYKRQYAMFSQSEFSVDSKVATNFMKGKSNMELDLKSLLKNDFINMELGFGLKKVDSDIYFVLNKIPSLFMLGISESNIPFEKGKWYSLPDEIKSNPEYTAFLKEFNDKVVNDGESMEIKRAAANLLDENKIIKVSYVGKEDLDGKSVSKYQLSLDATNIKPFLIGAMKMYYNEAAKTDKNLPELTKESIDTLSTQIDQMLADPSAKKAIKILENNLEMYMYIAKDNKPVKMEVTVNIIPGDDYKDVLSNSYVSVKLVALYSKLGEDIAITAPVNFEKFDLSKLSPYFMPSDGVNAKPTTIKK